MQPMSRDVETLSRYAQSTLASARGDITVEYTLDKDYAMSIYPVSDAMSQETYGRQVSQLFTVFIPDCTAFVLGDRLKRTGNSGYDYEVKSVRTYKTHQELTVANL